MRIAIEVFTIYGLYVVGVTLLITRYGGKDRFPMAVAAWAVPVIVFGAVFETAYLLLFRKKPRVRPCPSGLDSAELIVERHRQQMFGGESQTPRFAFEWARLYALSIEREAKLVETFVRESMAAAA